MSQLAVQRHKLLRQLRVAEQERTPIVSHASDLAADEGRHDYDVTELSDDVQRLTHNNQMLREESEALCRAHEWARQHAHCHKCRLGRLSWPLFKQPFFSALEHSFS